MLKFPGTLKLMKVFGPEIGKVFFQHIQQLKPTSEHRFVGRVVSTDAAHVFVHNLFKALEAVNRQEITWRNGSSDNFVATNVIGF